MDNDFLSGDNSSAGQNKNTPPDQQVKGDQNTSTQDSAATDVVFDAQDKIDVHKQVAPPQNLPTQEAPVLFKNAPSLLKSEAIDSQTAVPLGEAKYKEDDPGETIQISDTEAKKSRNDITPEIKKDVKTKETVEKLESKETQSLHESTSVLPKSKAIDSQIALPSDEMVENKQQSKGTKTIRKEIQQATEEKESEVTSLEQQLDAIAPEQKEKKVEIQKIGGGAVAKQNIKPRSKTGQSVAETPTEKILSHRDTIKVPLAKKTIPGVPLFAAQVLEQQKKQAAPIQQEQPVTPVIDGDPVITPETRKAPIVRTYKSDVAAALKRGKTSMTQLVMAEQEKKGFQKEKQPVSKKNIFIIIAIVLLVVAGLSAVAWVGGYKFKSKITPAGTTTINVPSLIFTEVKGEINVTDMSEEKVRSSIQNEIISTNIKLDSIKTLYFTEDAFIQTNEGMQAYKSIIDTKHFFEASDISVPARLDRSLDDEFMFGIHMFNGNQPFIILKTSYFENAFSGMLEWEPFLAEDILPIFAYTGTTTIYNEPFQDVVVKNRDLRVIKNDEGKNELLYMFLDKNTAIITTNLSTLDEIILRINKQKAKE
ncbi:hypothetical protein ACFL22_01090 [Patescibacteria group bacterium]